MIDLEKYKKALGEVTDDLSEEEILKVRQIQDDLAEAFFAMWLESKQKKDIISNIYLQDEHKNQK